MTEIEEIKASLAELGIKCLGAIREDAIIGLLGKEPRFFGKRRWRKEYNLRLKDFPLIAGMREGFK